MNTPNDSQITGEVNVKPIHYSKVIAEKLQGNDIEKTLEAVDGLWNANGLRRGRNRRIVVITNDNGLGFPGSYLRERGLNLYLEYVENVL